MKLRLLAALASLPLLLAACPGPDDPPVDGPNEATLVVGVQSEDLGGAVGPVHIVTKLDGAVVRDETVQVPPSGQPAASPTNPQLLPREIELKGKPDARVEVTVDAFAPGTTSPIIKRTAATRIVPSAKKLLRVVLDSRCAVLPGTPGIATCGANETCSSGRCIPAEVGVEQLEDYAPDWAAAPPDICRPAKHGPPEVVVGTGQTDYNGLTEGQILQLEKGPQGGHHIWIALRMKNLRQSGSTTTITSRIESDPGAAPPPPASYVFTFDRDEGSYCKLWGLRYQVDVGASDLAAEYKRFLGKKLAVTVEVADSTGAKASGTKIVQIADKLLCPDGTDKCNEP
jgi:hypothetical protein